MFFEAKMAVLEAMKPDIDALPAAERRKFAELCRHWADLAEPGLPERARSFPEPAAVSAAMSGVLLELNRGLRSEE
jgi:hypothetical protein